MSKRKIVLIDEQKCDGCGLCATACAEGAIRIVDGKARLISEIYCDGLGACLGECPRGAIAIEEREAVDFDPAAVERHLAGHSTSQAPHHPAAPPHFHGCPGSAVRDLRAPAADTAREPAAAGPAIPSALGNWPVQLTLVPPRAAYFDGADLLIAADCTPFALADFHARLLRGRVLLIGCPKLDDGQSYLEKLSHIFKANDIRSVEVAHMEVPCCSGLVRLVQLALQQAGKPIPATATRISIRGEVMQTVAIAT